MADAVPGNSGSGRSVLGEPRQAREPAIRTMRSDISEFLKTTKPSLVSLLARQAQWEEYHPLPAYHPWRWIILGIILSVMAGGVGLWYLRPGFIASPPVTSNATPPPFFFFEDTTDTIIADSRTAFFAALNASAIDPAGSFRRIIVRTKNGERTEILDTEQLLALSGGRLPTALLETVTGPPQLFRYRSALGPQFGLMVESRSPPRALGALINAEPTLALDLLFLYVGTPPPTSFAPYQDIAYKNISFRFLKLDPNADRGIGYLLFPARRLMVMATSEEALRAVIDRLFAAR